LFKKAREAIMLNNIIKFFKLEEKNTTVKKELTAGALTFVSLSYLIFLIPALLRQAGMGYGAPFTAVCVASAVMCILMGLIGNSAVPLAPLLSTSLFFIFSAVIDFDLSWKQALTIVLIEGLVFIIITAFNVRDFIADTIPAALKNAVYAGIGIFMILLGFRWAGIAVNGSKALVAMGDISHPAVVTSILGIVAVLILFLRRVKGSLILGSLITLVIAIIAGVFDLKGVVSLPPSMEPVFFSFDWPKSSQAADFIFVAIMLLYVHLFDAPAGRPASRLLSVIDAAATPIGAMLGMPNLGSSIEGNAGGVTTDGKTGLANIATGFLFIAALFFYPIARLLGLGVEVNSVNLYPVAAPVLILLGMLMLQKLQKINLADLSESFPAILTVLIIPFTFNIAHGLAFGVISYPVLKAIQGKFRDVPAAVYVLAGLFLVYYIFFY
jgi:AGZA family xanthine/uracil permease-like MFS transporter